MTKLYSIAMAGMLCSFLGMIAVFVVSAVRQTSEPPDTIFIFMWAFLAFALSILIPSVISDVIAAWRRKP